MWCLFALVEEKGVLPVYLPFFSNLDARQAFPWPDPRTLPSPLPQENGTVSSSFRLGTRSL